MQITLDAEAFGEGDLEQLVIEHGHKSGEEHRAALLAGGSRAFAAEMGGHKAYQTKLLDLPEWRQFYDHADESSPNNRVAYLLDLWKVAFMAGRWLWVLDVGRHVIRHPVRP